MAKEPYITTTPWLPFTLRERKRAQILARCPSAACRRAKACVDAHDDLYCQRSHESVAEARRHFKPDPKFATLPLNPTFDQVQAHVIVTDTRLAEAKARTQDMRQKWKSGIFDGLYGKFRADGVWKHPPDRQYTE
jgi:hypothetical protein